MGKTGDHSTVSVNTLSLIWVLIKGMELWLLPPLEVPSWTMWTFAIAARGDSLCWAPASPAFGVLQVLGRAMGVWMEAALWSMANCFVVPLRP